MDRADVLLRLLQSLLAAPGTREGWEVFLDVLCDAIDGSAASFILHDLTAHQSSVIVTARTDPEAIALYQSVWGPLDPWAHHPRTASLRSGDVVLCQALVPDAALKRTAFYNDFSQHYDIVGAVTGMIEAGPDALSVVSVNHSQARGSFDEADAALLKALMPHLQRSVTVHRRLVGAELRSRSFEAVLDELPHGVMMLSVSGRLQFANRAAESMLRARDGLTIERGDLRAATPTATDVLRQTLSAAAGLASGDINEGRTTCRLPRPSGARPYIAVAAPAPASAGDIGVTSRTVMLFVSDPDAAVSISLDRLRASLALSGAEARVAQCLAQGDTLEQAAERCAISQHTARTHLRRIFEKTGTTRQADLVRMLAALSIPVSDQD